jgi:hypothetical protein
MGILVSSPEHEKAAAAAESFILDEELPVGYYWPISQALKIRVE